MDTWVRESHSRWKQKRKTHRGAISSPVRVRRGSVWENDSREKGRDRL